MNRPTRVPLNVRVPPLMAKALDQFSEREFCTRSTAVRILLTRALVEAGYAPPKLEQHRRYLVKLHRCGVPIPPGMETYPESGPERLSHGPRP